MSQQELTRSPEQVLQECWGYESFRPLQREAISCVLEGRDSVVILPTGGGKSLCFQVPAVCLGGLAVVVSPLISLMKDQVDALNGVGVPAAYLNSSLSSIERQQVIAEIESGVTRLLYVAPEGLVKTSTIQLLKSVNLTLIAVDEAHCISEWGHDFRPEFRQLRNLRRTFPHVNIHAYTATATERVRADIARELDLREPEMLVGSFDRPNLIYRVARRSNRLSQVKEVLERHTNESGIIYCITRSEVDFFSSKLAAEGYSILPYHAGLSDQERKDNQEAFIEESVDLIAATVAFGMGIDKANVRFVIHSGMPKSLENYQQESGRAGRDGLEAECCLLYNGKDYNTWKMISEDTHQRNLSQVMASLDKMYDYCRGVTCRHRQLVNHFGQDYPHQSCEACDVCLEDLDLADDPLIIGQKILSSVIRQKQRFGGDYTAMVLKGSTDKRILQNGHDQLSTYGLLSDEDKRTIRDWIEQLVGQGFLAKVGDYNVLQVTPEGRQLLKGEVTPRLLKPKKVSGDGKRQSKVAEVSWEGVDRGLFRELRKLRRQLAQDQNVAAYIVFSDAALRDMARLKPMTLEDFESVKGVGAKRLNDYGSTFLECIGNYCEANPVSE